MVDRTKLDRVYLKMADNLSSLSHAKRTKVGCLIVKDTQIISEGYNGTPRGFNNDCEYINHVDELYTKPEVLHAESNAITKLARSTNSSEGATLYVTCSPCFDCAKLIIQSGIRRVVYKDMYTNKNCMEALALLAKAEVTVIQMKENKELS
jgi:dCMP deaminase|tara:strand:- start:1679 stop:2131 length:453 start_codon:yes stop_codon:yes gene_type:complete